MKPPRQRNCGRCGFSLLELLAVLAIMVILTTLFLVGLSAVMERAKQAKCINNLRQLGVAVSLYAQDNGGRLPVHTMYWYPSWFDYVKPYLDGKKVPYCPSFDFKTRTPGQGYTGYSYNANFGEINHIEGGMIQKNQMVFLHPAITPVFWEDTQSGGNPYGGWPASWGGTSYQFDFRHNDMMNVLMLDNHVEQLRKPTGAALQNATSFPQYKWEGR